MSEFTKGALLTIALTLVAWVWVLLLATNSAVSQGFKEGVCLTECQHDGYTVGEIQDGKCYCSSPVERP